MNWNNVTSEIKKNISQWTIEFKKNFYLILFSIILLIVAGVIDYFMGIYVTKTAAVKEVFDLILDHFGPYNLNFLFVYGYLTIVVIFFAYPLIFRIHKFHVALSQFSLLITIRSLFITLTHLKTPLSAIPVHFPRFLTVLRFQNDMFFSGHVAIPFLGFLLFDDKRVKYFFLISSITMAITVLLTHQHYSIDVFSAFFIAYGSYKIGDYFLKKLKK